MEVVQDPHNFQESLANTTALDFVTGLTRRELRKRRLTPLLRKTYLHIFDFPIGHSRFVASSYHDKVNMHLFSS